MNTVMCYEMKYAGAAREAMAKIHQLLHAENLDSISVHNDVISNVNVCPVNGIKRLRIAINQVLPIKGIDQYSHFVQKTSRRYICSRDLWGKQATCKRTAKTRGTSISRCSNPVIVMSQQCLFCVRQSCSWDHPRSINIHKETHGCRGCVNKGTYS